MSKQKVKEMCDVCLELRPEGAEVAFPAQEGGNAQHGCECAWQQANIQQTSMAHPYLIWGCAEESVE